MAVPPTVNIPNGRDLLLNAWYKNEWYIN
jgi:hypothetical protein